MRLPVNLLEAGVRETAAQLKELKNSWKWHGYNIYIADGTTALLPDTEENQDEFPQQKNQKPGLGFPIIRICALVSLATGMIADYALAPYEGKGTGETSLFSRMRETLTEGSLLIADRYYATFAIIMVLNLDGIAVVMRNHAGRQVDYRKGKCLGQKDHIVELKKPKRVPPWMSQEDYDKLPDTLTIREFRINGINYITNLIDHKNFYRKEMALLYDQRWSIEVDIRSIKTHMGMEMLSCLTPTMIRKEIAIYFMAYNLVWTVITQSSIIHEKIPRMISFKGASQLIIASASTIIKTANQCLMDIANAILLAISSNPIGNRKQEPQPRAIKRRPKPYPLLTMPRRDAVLLL